jgi:hypothetical protein
MEDISNFSNSIQKKLRSATFLFCFGKQRQDEAQQQINVASKFSAAMTLAAQRF